MKTQSYFCNLVQEVCQNPKKFTDNGTFYEVGLFLSSEANGKKVFGKRFIHGLDPFHRWLCKYEEFNRRVDFVSWGHILEKYKTEEIALAKFPNLFQQFMTEFQMKNNFLTTSDYNRSELEEIIQLAFQFKWNQIEDKPLSGKSVALVFFNPSLRTRASMQVGVYELGGNAVILEPGGTSWTLEHRDGVVMDGDKTEHLAEFVQVLERYVAAIGVRTFANLEDWNLERTEPILSAFARYATKPVINLESAMHHPCQSMADMMTIRERFGAARKKVLLTWAFHPKPLPMAVPNSFALASAQFGHDLRIAYPQGYELDDELLTEIERQAKENGGSLEIVNDVNAAFDGAEVVYAKSFGSKNFYGDLQKDIEFRANLRSDWIVDEAKMARTRDAIFMHCLPVRRNVIVTDGVIDSANSIVLDEAENRLHIQKAIMAKLLR